MIRATDWERRLADYLDPLRDRPFAWGTNDCCTLAAGAVMAMTGIDAMAEFRGRYSTRRGSIVALGRYGAGSIEATLDTKFAQVPPALAARGDLVLTDSGLGIVLGRWSVHVGEAGGRKGLIRLTRDQWLRAWRVPMKETDHG